MAGQTGTGGVGGSSPREFQTTIWSEVLRARDGEDTRSHEALSSLCARYWYPIYSYVRRRGYGMHDAQDLTQGFFSQLLEKDYLQKVTGSNGRFRSFLLTAVKWHLSKSREKEMAEKRGGGSFKFSLDEDLAEERFLAESPSVSSPEDNYDQQFARAVLQRALKRVREETEPNRYEALSRHLLDRGGGRSYAQTAEEMGLSETAVKSAVSRMRQRCGEYFRTEIAETTSPDELEDELRHLLSLIAGRL